MLWSPVHYDVQAKPSCACTISRLAFKGKAWTSPQWWPGRQRWRGGDCWVSLEDTAIKGLYSAKTAAQPELETGLRRWCSACIWHPIQGEEVLCCVCCEVTDGLSTGQDRLWTKWHFEASDYDFTTQSCSVCMPWMHLTARGRARHLEARELQGQWSHNKDGGLNSTVQHPRGQGPCQPGVKATQVRLTLDIWYCSVFKGYWMGCIGYWIGCIGYEMG